MNKLKVAITIRSFDLEGTAMELLNKYFDVVYVNTCGQRLNEKEIIEAVGDVDAVIAGTESFSARIINSLTKLKAISRVGVGTDTIDSEAAAKKGVSIFITPNSPVQAVAEHTLALILSLLKHIPQYNENLRHGKYSVLPANLLAGKRVGIIGMGHIGQRVAELLEGIGCRISYFDPYIRKSVSSNWDRIHDMENLLTNADIITLHAAPQRNQVPILDLAVLKKCRKGAIIINTARGSFIDEHALALALKEGWIAGAGLDVSQTEPLSGPLLDFTQVVVTPHVASNALETRQQMEMEAVMNLIEWQKREKK